MSVVCIHTNALLPRPFRTAAPLCEDDNHNWRRAGQGPWKEKTGEGRNKGGKDKKDKSGW